MDENPVLDPFPEAQKRKETESRRVWDKFSQNLQILQILQLTRFSHLPKLCQFCHFHVTRIVCSNECKIEDEVMIATKALEVKYTSSSLTHFLL